MNPSGVETLTNPHPRGHIVYPYSDEAQVTEAICLFASAGLKKGEAVLLIMSETHRQVAKLLLLEEGFDLQQLESTSQLIFVDAQVLLDQFMFDGIIDEQKFKAAVGGMISQAKASSDNRPVRVFGEMVDLISTSNPKGTQRLEELWNDVIETHCVPLLCAYCLSGSRPTLDPGLVACHSHAIA